MAFRRLSIQMTNTGGLSRVQDQPGLHSYSQANWAIEARSCLKKMKNQGGKKRKENLKIPLKITEKQRGQPFPLHLQAWPPTLAMVAHVGLDDGLSKWKNKTLRASTHTFLIGLKVL